MIEKTSSHIFQEMPLIERLLNKRTFRPPRPSGTPPNLGGERDAFHGLKKCLPQLMEGISI